MVLIARPTALSCAQGLDDEALTKAHDRGRQHEGRTDALDVTHDFQVDAAKTGIAEASSIFTPNSPPFRFPTASTWKREEMEFSLVSRELIANSIEAVRSTAWL